MGSGFKPILSGNLICPPRAIRIHREGEAGTIVTALPYCPKKLAWNSQAFQSRNYLRLSAFISLTSAVDLSIKDL